MNDHKTLACRAQKTFEEYFVNLRSDRQSSPESVEEFLQGDEACIRFSDHNYVYINGAKFF